MKNGNFKTRSRLNQTRLAYDKNNVNPKCFQTTSKHLYNNL